MGSKKSVNKRRFNRDINLNIQLPKTEEFIHNVDESTKENNASEENLNVLPETSSSEEIFEDNVPHFELIEIPLDRVISSEQQPRTKFSKKKLEELAESIKEHGVVQAIKVRPVGDGNYMLVSGERRWRASKLAGKETITAVVDWNITPEKAGEEALIENIQREDLHPYDKAMAVAALKEKYMGRLTDEEIAKKIGKDRKTLYSWLSISSIPQDIFVELYNHKLSSERHVKAIRLLKPNKEMMDQLKNEIISQGLSGQDAVKRAKEMLNILPKETPTAKTLNAIYSLNDLLRLKQKLVTTECISELKMMATVINNMLDEFSEKEIV